MKRSDHKVVRERKGNLKRRLDRRNFKGAGRPIFSGGNVRYEMAERVRGVACGGIGAIHTMVRALGLDAALNEALLLLEIHAPYFESDHVLNMTYNILTGGDCLEDLERLREDETYMDAIGAERIADPTTAGDFCRRSMEFKKFIHNIVLIPCQVVKKARHLVCRILSYNSWLVTFFQTYDVIRALRFT